MSSKRADTELEQESSKKQKIDDDKETAKLKQLVNLIPDEEGVAIDVIPLAVKPLSIVDWKIQKEGKKSYYKIIRADGSSNIYLVFSHMLKHFDREDVETLWKLIKAKHGSTRPEGDYERLDEEVALKLQAEFKKEQRLAEERAQQQEEEANIALIESWDDVQEKIDADYLLAERLQAEEQ
nr:hypothetical protein [Tanacetum cinerariifolium]